MAELHETGRKGEEIARNLLLKKGYKILETNWRCGRNEVDIIARDGRFIVVVEVKTRMEGPLVEPEKAVDKEKRKSIVRAANAFVKFRNINDETRFDIITVILHPDRAEVNHIEDAFYATLR